MQQLQEQQHAHMNQMFEAFAAAALPASHGIKNLDEQRFRELGSFGGNEEEWKEFALQVSGHREGDQSEAPLADQVGRDGA